MNGLKKKKRKQGKRREEESSEGREQMSGVWGGDQVRSRMNRREG